MKKPQPANSLLSGIVSMPKDGEAAPVEPLERGEPVNQAQRKKGKADAAKKKGQAENAGNVDNGSSSKDRELIRKGAPPMPLFPPGPAGYRARLEWMMNYGVDNAARTAIKDLQAMDAEEKEHDPNAKLDPAAWASVLARAHLWGRDPKDVLLDTHGLKKVAIALRAALGLESISLTLGDETVDIGYKGQRKWVLAADLVSVGDKE